nr:dnaJ domain containing protein 3 [Dermatophagoides farinae]
MKNYYIRISKAFEVLSNEIERSKYDSTLFFDNYLPLEIDEANFFEVVKKNLEKESFFINESPIPDFGDQNLPIEAVQNFYKFWRNATSWRDFSLATLYDKSTGCDKDERRNMVKENQRRITKLQKYNNERLAKFILACEKADPRLKQKGSTPSKKVDPKLLNRQRLEKKMKDAANMKNAVAQIKSLYTKLTSKTKDLTKAEQLSKTLNQWLTKATLHQIMQLQANLEFESFLFNEPNLLSANRTLKLVDKAVNNQL